MGSAQQEDLLRLSAKNFEHLVRSVHNDGILLRQCGIVLGGPLVLLPHALSDLPADFVGLPLGERALC